MNSFTGIATELGVESSARDALNRYFYPVIVSDAVLHHQIKMHIRTLIAKHGNVSYCYFNE